MPQKKKVCVGSSAGLKENRTMRAFGIEFDHPNQSLGF